MKRTILMLVAALIVHGASTSAAARTLKLGTLAPEGSVWHETIRDMAEAWKATPGADIEVRIYPGGVIGDESDMIRKMRIGQLHVAALTGAGLATIAPEILALQMPMMLRSDAELDYVRQRLGPRLEAILEAKGFKLLTWGDAGWVHVFAQRPVVYPDDLKPLKLFTWAGNTKTIDLMTHAGLKPVPLETDDILTGLQTGLIDAVPMPPFYALALQVYRHAPHMLDLHWAPLVGALVVTSKAWERVPVELRSQLREAAEQTGAEIKAAGRNESVQSILTMREKWGLTVHELTPAIEAEWRAATEAAYPKIRGRIVPADIFDEVRSLLREYRAAGGTAP